MLIRISTKLFHSSESTHAGSSTERGLNSFGFSVLGFSETDPLFIYFYYFESCFDSDTLCVKNFTSSGKNFTSVVKIFN